ncbi:hypothetical protein N7510_009946 [Penicillium lagena]|uniref:uncharacterized protein n=1 Tax=Penicillium lagena TaxID=94218 RepID=UPI0025406D01|nr:uncharacterized protein N7510_009946 [Penicillium lagena]KAJ5604792.1 hypothetical protein N7510_009946 [Penicillium lagena]
MASISFGDANSGLQLGINQGWICLSPERPEPHPEPLSTVPFLPDPDFVSRDALLDQIHEKVLIPGSRTVLVGLGGVGKTQLAIEYSHRVRRQSSETWVFWIHASNLTRCENSLRDLADRVKIPGRKDRNANIFRVVSNWLQDAKIGKWILVLDNVDDDELLSKPSSDQRQVDGQRDTSTQPPLRYLLESSNGSIIVTSRNKRVALDIASHKNIIEVQPMNEAEALDLLQKKLNKHIVDDDIVLLVEALDFIPLAIVQAAAYIANRSPRCSVAQYLEEFRNSDQAMRLLNYEAKLVNRDWEAKNSILVTWQISFDHLRRAKESAADLLSLMSLFDPQGIPECILQSTQKTQDHQSRLYRMYRVILSVGRDGYRRSHSGRLKGVIGSPYSNRATAYTEPTEDTFDEDIEILRHYSFVLMEQGPKVFQIHRLVQLATLRWLRIQGRIEFWKEIFTGKILQAFPTNHYDDWENCKSLFPHVKSALSQPPESNKALLEWTRLLHKGALYAIKQGSFSDAEELASKSMITRGEILGAKHSKARSSARILVVTYLHQGRWREAESLQLQILKRTFGSQNFNTLSDMANLASTYRNQGRWEEAEQLYVQVIERSKTKLGEDHPDTLTSMANLASTYWNQGRWKEAEQLYVQVIERCKTKLDEYHPTTLMIINNLALTYRSQGRWDEARKLFMRVAEASTMKLGEDHPFTLTSTANLASIFYLQGQWNEAEKLYVQMIERRKKKLGKDHPDKLEAVAGLAQIFWSQGRLDEAEKLLVQVIETSKMKLGEDHPDTLTNMANLASTYRSQGRWEEAEQLYVQVIERRNTKFGEDHPNTMAAINNLATIYQEQGRWDKAGKLLVQVTEMSKTKLGEDHPDTLTSMANLASTYWNQGRWKEAEQLDVQVIKTRMTKLGEDHPDTLTSMANLAFTLKFAGLRSDAIDLLRKCLAKQQRILGPAHPHVVSNSNALLEWETGALDIDS